MPKRPASSRPWTSGYGTAYGRASGSSGRKHPKTRARALAALGMPLWAAWLRAGSAKGIWRMAGGPLNGILGVAYWRAQGYISLSDRYQRRYA